MAISFCDTEERAYLKDIQKLIKIELPVVSNHEYHSATPQKVSSNQPEKIKKPAPRNRMVKQSYYKSGRSSN